MNTIVIIPAYNEAQKIGDVVRAVRERGFDVAVVDDGSHDATAVEARRGGAIVLSHVINRGYGSALETGNQYALRKGYDCVVHFDGDGQHDPDEIANVIRPINERECDVVIGSRFMQSGSNVPLFRAFLIKAAILFTWFFSGVRLSDAHNGFRAFGRTALKSIDCRQDGMAYASEVIDQIGERSLSYKEVPITVHYSAYSRKKGESNIKKILVGVRFLWSKLMR